jgi:hypothetical protein
VEENNNLPTLKNLAKFLMIFKLIVAIFGGIEVKLEEVFVTDKGRHSQTMISADFLLSSGLLRSALALPH